MNVRLLGIGKNTKLRKATKYGRVRQIIVIIIGATYVQKDFRFELALSRY